MLEFHFLPPLSFSCCMNHVTRHHLVNFLTSMFLPGLDSWLLLLKSSYQRLRPMPFSTFFAIFFCLYIVLDYNNEYAARSVEFLNENWEINFNLPFELLIPLFSLHIIYVWDRHVVLCNWQLLKQIV